MPRDPRLATRVQATLTRAATACTHAADLCRDRSGLQAEAQLLRLAAHMPGASRDTLEITWAILAGVGLMEARERTPVLLSQTPGLLLRRRWRAAPR